MRLTALYVCGTLLAVSSLFWTVVDSDEGDVQEDNGFGPCAATLRPEGPCRQGQDESTCPYLFSLPPLEFHLPKQLRELEKIVKDLQKLKDNVDQLRKMCADCTVSQNERECGIQSEHEKLNECTDKHKEERNRLNERHPEKLKDPTQKCGKDRVTEETTEGQGDTNSEKRAILEEKGGKKWEAERESEKGVIKNNKNTEILKEVAEKDGKTQTKGAKGKDKLGQEAVPTAGENEKTVDTVRKNVAEKNNREKETDKNKEKDVTVYSNREDMLENGKERENKSHTQNKEKKEESDHPVWRDETKETEKKTQTEEDRGSDGIKMSEDHDKHTNKEREQHGEERKKEMEKGIKVERNNEKPKQTESIGRAEEEMTIKEGEAEEDREKGKEIKTDGEKAVQSVQRDTDGESATSKAFERTDFVSITPTPHSDISLVPRYDSIDSNKAITFTTSLPSPPLASTTSHWITGVSQGITTTADGLLTQSTGLEAAGDSEHPIPDVEAGFKSTSRLITSTTSTLGGPRQEITSTTRPTSLTSARPGADLQGQVSSSMATTTPTPLYTISLPGVTDRSPWTAKKNISSSTKTDMNPPPGRGLKPSKPATKPEADRKTKNPKNDSKPDRAPLPDKKTKHDQKQKPSHQKPTTDQRSKPAQIPKPDQRPLSDNLQTDRNLKNSHIPKHDQEITTDQNQLPFQKPKSHQNSMPPVQRSTSQPRPQTVNTTGSDKDPLTDREDETTEIQNFNQNSKPAKKPVHPLKTDKPDQQQKPHKEPQTEGKTKPDQRSTLNQGFSPVQEPKPDRSERTSLTPIPNLKPETHLTENSDENTSPKTKSVQDLLPEQKLIPDHTLTKPPDHKSKPSQKIPKINQKLNPGQKYPDLTAGQNTKPNVKPKPDQTPQTNQGLKTPQPVQTPNVNPKSVPDEIPEAELDKTSTVRHLPKYGQPNRTTVGPGATSDQRQKPSVKLGPSSNTKTNADPFQIGRTDSDGIQSSQTNRPPASGTVKQFAEVTHSLGHTESSSSKKKTIDPGPKTSDSLDTGPFPRLHTVPESFTTSPNSRITSDLRPETASQPTLVPMTTTPNKIMRGILPSVVPSTSPGSTAPRQVSNTDSSLQAKIFHKVEETTPRQTPGKDKTITPVHSPNVQTASITSPDLRSTNPTTSGPEPLALEASTPSARELRVKINQVAAFFNNSLSPNGRPQDRRPKEHPEDNQGHSRPDRPESKRPTLIPSEGTLMKRDCSDYLLKGTKTKSGVYLVTPDLRSRSFPVFCDMKLGGGGWTLLQRRQDGSVSFNRTWAEYRSGFGEVDGGEFWLGNNMIHLLTQDREMVLRVELEDFDGVMKYAEYEQFRVASERLRYRLNIGRYSGTAGDALRFSRSYDHNNRAFTTPDRDHDRYPSGNCGAYYSSGWWFDACMAANLNGRYYVGKYKGVRDGIFWGTWHNISTEYYPTNDRQSFKTVRMMIRPKGFTP